jgi:hypothetical protein
MKLPSMLSVVCLAMFALALTPGAKADEYNRKTIVTFNAPVEIPGQVLGPGTYVFKLLDSPSDRNIVQIFNKDENHLYATILALPDYRMKPAGKTVITFEERAAGAPEAIRAWFYPGDNYGEEFVYPKVKAMELAKANTSQHVLSMPNDMAANTKKPATSTSESQVVAMKQAPVKAIEHGGTEVEVAEVHPPAPAAAKQPMQTASIKRLPQTASSLPFLALLGIVFLAAGFGVRSLSKQIL